MFNCIDGSLRVASPMRIAALVLLSLLLPGCGGPKTMLSTSPELTHLEITPEKSSIALGQTVHFKATGMFNDGSSKDETQSAVWTSSNGSVASIDTTGFATSLAVGNAAMIARVGGLSGSATLTVSKAAIVSITVDPSASLIALGATAQLKATGSYTDQSTHDVTDIVTWKSSEPNIAIVSSTGLIGSRSIGKASITATSGVANASSQLTVLPAALVSIAVTRDHATVSLGTTVQFKAQGVYTDGSERDLTDFISWSGSPHGIVSINPSGLATGEKIGTATVNARSETITGANTLTVSAALLTSIAVTSHNDMMPLGTTQQMSAIGRYTDGSSRDLTNSVSWFSASDHVVSISGSGVADAKSLGTSIISATSAGISGNVLLTVSHAALMTIGISPANSTIPLASSLQLAAIGSFTDGSMLDLTDSVLWGVDNTSVMYVSSTGNATARHVGSTGVNATLSGIQSSTTIIVEPIAAISYFTAEPNGVDTTLRLTNPGSDEPNLCAMVYVFDQHQQMAECCGCRISQDGLRTLSLDRDLIGNPLTGTVPVKGSVILTTADYVSNPSCNPSSITPTGAAISWATHLQSPAPNFSAITEEPLSQTPLKGTLQSALQAQCKFIQQLGGGHGLCSCGTGH
jgi:hypothetical protein